LDYNDSAPEAARGGANQLLRESEMAKGQLRSNKEAKKPKKDKTKAPTPASPFASTQARQGGSAPEKKK
jgi:hypothetical protein